MSKKRAFWSMWIYITLSVIIGFYLNGELEQVDFGKSIVLTMIPLAIAYPLYRWVKSNDDFI
ncbi:hypothetical protein AADZ86_07145 [Colwelliaceae bacterium BS250]